MRIPQTLAKFNFWHNKEPSTKINITFFLPTGICITLPLIQADTALIEIKELLWIQAEKHAKFHQLKLKEDYVFEAVSSKGGTEELLDETLALFDYKPFRPYLKVVQRIGDVSEKLLNSKINMLIGHSVTVQLNSPRNEEVGDFRYHYNDFINSISMQRDKSSWVRRAIYAYPPEYTDNELPISLKAKLVFTDWSLILNVHRDSAKSFPLRVHINTFPSDVIKMVLEKHEIPLDTRDDYILKVYGRQVYFLGEICLTEGYEEYIEKYIVKYKYIHDCLAWNKPIQIQLKKRSDMGIKKRNAAKGSFNRPRRQPIKSKKMASSWQISLGTRFKIKIICGLRLNILNIPKAVVCGIYHGATQLCPLVWTQFEDLQTQWNETMQFTIPVSQLPRMAKLCFAVVGRQKNDKTTLSWVNVPIMDFKGNFKTGVIRLKCWPSFGKAKDDSTFLNPIGTVSQPDNENGPSIVIEQMKFANSIAYPNEQELMHYALLFAKRDNAQDIIPTQTERDKLEETISKDSLAELYEDEKKTLWKLRFVCCVEYPDSLSKLLHTVRWDNKEDVSQLYFLLANWNADGMKLEVALDVLDYRFPDPKVRKIAVRVLDCLSDAELEMYLLQLTQALKYELYLHSELARYLLKRALNNRRLGHYLFWHLKAEVKNPECALQFGLLLEMYCRGAVHHIDSLSKQVEAINKLKTVTELLQGYKDTTKQKKFMHDLFQKEGYAKAFRDWVSPLEPSIVLKELKVEKCKCMNSAKKPLWLVFSNPDDGADDIYIIFKNGDDLRQDMLTLLSLRIMENIWRKEDLDYGLIPYKCLATGHQVGLIEVVTDSETLALIQKAKGKLGVLKEDALYNWIEEKHTDDNLKWCVNNFTKSVVGYSIATFVLGIGDRHNDNVMMKNDTGQLFHIDFGHFLGNWKSKFGFRRERVAFVLPDEFIYIIQRNGREKSEKENFDKFKEMCIQAFSILRKNGNLFITVFAMLLSTGIPELRQPSDLNFLRHSFAVESDETEAIEHFDYYFKEAYEKRKSTSFMWMIHNMKHHWT